MTAMRSPYLQSSGGAGPSPHLTLGEGAKPSGRGRGAGLDFSLASSHLHPLEGKAVLAGLHGLCFAASRKPVPWQVWGYEHSSNGPFWGDPWGEDGSGHSERGTPPVVGLASGVSPRPSAWCWEGGG